MQCEAGKYSGTGQSSCTRCEAGKYSAQPSSSTCTSCESGRTSSVGSDSVASCEPLTCPAGYFIPEYLPETSLYCARCSRGKYQSASSHRERSCINCPANTYNALTGASDCTSCDDGWTSPAGSTSSSSCRRETYQERNTSPPPGSNAGSIAASPRAAWALAVALCLMRFC